MPRLILILLCLAGFYQGIPSFAATTNQVPDSVTTTNAAPNYSNAELQAAAKEVWHKLILFATLALLGGVIVTGFAIYGAYRKFGLIGVVVVCTIVAFGVIALGGLLLIF